MRHLPLLSPFSPPTSRRRRRIGIGHGKEEGAKEEGPLRFRFMAQRNIECVAAVCPFSEPLCLRMRPGCQRRRPPTDDRRGPEDPRPNTAKIHLVRYCRGTEEGKEKKYPFTALFFFVPFLLPFLPISPTCCTTLCPYPISGSTPTLFLFPFLRRSEAREIFMLP